MADIVGLLDAPPTTSVRLALFPQPASSLFRSCPREAPVNSPASGAPAINGTARVGQTLTASTVDGTDSFSTSFLDGLLLKLVAGNHLPNVLFETNDARKRTILGRLSSVRSIDIQLLNEQGNVEKVRPVPYKSFSVKFVENKSNMTSPASSSSAGATHA